MTTPIDPRATDGATGSEPTTQAEIEADIARTREQLAQTVQALSDRLDVKARARHKLDEARSRGQDVVSRARSTTVDGEGRPNNVIPLGAALVAVALGAVVMAAVRSRRA